MSPIGEERPKRNFALDANVAHVNEAKMNTANLQLEGLYAAVAALMNSLREKGVMTTDEIDACLRDAEVVNTSARRTLSPSNVDAIRFPFRYLRAANRTAAAGQPKSFFDIATEIGMTKDS
jgi:hypothetical protein